MRCLVAALGVAALAVGCRRTTRASPNPDDVEIRPLLEAYAADLAEVAKIALEKRPLGGWTVSPATGTRLATRSEVVEAHVSLEGEMRIPPLRGEE